MAMLNNQRAYIYIHTVSYTYNIYIYVCVCVYIYIHTVYYVAQPSTTPLFDGLLLDLFSNLPNGSTSDGLGSPGCR